MKDTNEIKAFRAISTVMAGLDDNETDRVRVWFREKYVRTNFLEVIVEHCNSLEEENGVLSAKIKKLEKIAKVIESQQKEIRT